MTPLIVRVDERTETRVVAGALGCPRCDAEWPIVAGTAHFGAAPPSRERAIDHIVAGALLGLTEPGMLVLADGIDAASCAALVAHYQVSVVVLDGDAAHAAATITGARVVPLARELCDAAILARGDRSQSFVASAVASVAVGGRVVLASGLPVPARVTCLASDARWTVCTRDADETHVPLRRAPGAPGVA